MVTWMEFKRQWAHSFGFLWLRKCLTVFRLPRSLRKAREEMESCVSLILHPHLSRLHVFVFFPTSFRRKWKWSLLELSSGQSHRPCPPTQTWPSPSNCGLGGTWEYLTRWILLTSSIVNTASGLPSELTSYWELSGCWHLAVCYSTAPIYVEGVLLPHLEMEIWHFRRTCGGLTVCS